jgi:hypothetical protein
VQKGETQMGGVPERDRPRARGAQLEQLLAGREIVEEEREVVSRVEELPVLRLRHRAGVRTEHWAAPPPLEHDPVREGNSVPAEPHGVQGVECIPVTLAPGEADERSYRAEKPGIELHHPLEDLARLDPRLPSEWLIGEEQEG